MVALPVEKTETVLTARGIKKSFKSVEVLHGVDFDLYRGEVHGLVGQNGAGKSTLMKIINGVYARDEGVITVNGREVALGSPNAANDAGIAMVFQEFSLVPSMTAIQNIFLGREPLRRGLIDEKACRAKAMKLFEELGVAIDPDVEISRLSVGEKQIVEVVKALSQDASILILDEPTSSLSSVEIDTLFKVVRKLKQDGIGIIFVSHHLDEIVELCDRVTVLRDGDVVLADVVANLKLQDIITAMIGRKLESSGQQEARAIDRTAALLEVKDLSLDTRLKNVSFSLYPGEVLGLAGVLGSGRSEILKAIYGILRPDRGEIVLKGQPLAADHPEKAIRSGVILVPEDRRQTGFIAGQSLRFNVLLPIWRRLVRGLFINDKKGIALVDSYMGRLNIRATGIEQNVERLSGGNQQKVVFAKSLATEPTVLLLDDPTVGVDIATKGDIAHIIRDLAATGSGVIFVSSEMEEIAELCDRVLVLRRGQITQEIERDGTHLLSEENLMRAIHGEAIA